MLYFIKKDFSFYILRVVFLFVYVVVVVVVYLCKSRMASHKMPAKRTSGKQQCVFDQ